MEYLETERLDDRHRLALTYCDMPVEWLDIDGLGIFVTGPRDSEHLSTGPATRQLETISEHATDRESALVAMAKHLSRQGYPHRVINSRGYSQGDWVTGIAYLDTAATGTPWEYAHAVLDAALDQWCAWLWGDTYLLAIQRLVTYTAPGYPPLDKWLPVDDGAIVFAARSRPGDTLADMAAHHGLDLSTYTTRESETV